MRRPKWRRVVKWGGGALLALLLLGGGIFGLFIWRFLPFPPDTDFPPPRDVSEARLQDIAQLRHLPDLDWSYDRQEEERFHAYLDDLSGRVADLSDAAFDLAVRRAAALADNAHSNVSPVLAARSYPLLPLRFYRFAEGFIVARAHETHADLLGARLVSVDGTPAEEVASRLATSIGGGDARRRYYDAVLLLAPDLLHADGLANARDRLTLVFQTPDGGESRREVTPLPAGQSPLGAPFTVLLPRELRGEDGAWRRVRPAGGAQRRLARQEEAAYHERLEGGRGVYIRVRRMESGELEVALREALADIREIAPRFVVADLRDNPGGGTRGAAFARALPEALGPETRVYVLVNRGTFSAAMMFAALLETHGGDRVVFVGESFGDRPRFWADGGPVLRLPNSGISVPIWRAYYDLERGCPIWWKCFWMYVPGEPRAGVLAIDTHVEPRFADFSAGRDTELQHVLALEARSGGDTP